MSLTVKGHRLLIKPSKVLDDMNAAIPDSLKNLGFEVSVGGNREKLMYEFGVEKGTVVKVGNMAWKSVDLGFGVPGWEPWAKEGDVITFVKFAGRPQIDPTTKEEFLVINDVDMLALVEDDKDAD